MKKVSDTSVELARKFNWSFVESTKDGKMRSIEDIHKEIYNLVTQKIQNKN